VPNRSYIFNITWTDNVFLDTVIFEWDETANYTNTTTIPVQNLGSGKYSITFTDFAQDNYTYRWYADDQRSVFNSTSLLAFNVTRADNPIVIYLNDNSNQSLAINDGATINVTVTGGNTVLYKNDSIVANPYIDILPKGYYIFKANSSGNRNYTVNSTGTTSYLTVVYPPPRYSISTTIPTTWYLNAYALFNITWTDSNDANGFNTAFVELNHSGAATNYTMSRISGTNISTYGLNLSMPMVLTWRVFANNSHNTWNATTLTTSTIDKISPTLLLNVTPSWDVVRGTMTVISCTSGQVSVNLYRDGVLVSNPDMQTLSTGAYVYVCNNTATTNYSTTSTSKILNVLRYTANISFIDAPALVSVKQNSLGSAAVVVKNVGNASYAVNFTVENITSSWYTLNATTATLGAGEKVAFLVNFSIGESVEVKDYAGRYKAGTVDRIITSDFVLRVSPKEATQTNISIDLSLYRVNMTKVWADINSSKATGVNVTLSEQKIIEAKGKIDLAQIYINNGDYFSAYQLLDGIRTLIEAANAQLQVDLEAAGIKPETSTPAPINWTIWAIVAAAICGGGFLAYLLWPQPGYNQKTGRFTYKTPQERGLEALSGAKEKIASNINKPDVAYKSSFKPGFKSSFNQTQIQQSSVMLPGVKVEQPIVKKGRFTLEGKNIKEKAFQKISKIKNLKDIFKKKQNYSFK
jgi:hypothetical protein